jgi:hypothetical protein
VSDDEFYSVEDDPQLAQDLEREGEVAFAFYFGLAIGMATGALLIFLGQRLF